MEKTETDSAIIQTEYFAGTGLKQKTQTEDKVVFSQAGKTRLFFYANLYYKGSKR